MLSPASLAAFSAAVSPAGHGHAGPVNRIRAAGPQQQPTPSAAPTPATAPTRDGNATPNKLLPRGSLLDLSV